MTTHFEHLTRPKSQRLADLERKTAELERKLCEARDSLDRELAGGAGAPPGYGQEAVLAYQPELMLDDGPGLVPDYSRDPVSGYDCEPTVGYGPGTMPGHGPGTMPGYGPGSAPGHVADADLGLDADPDPSYGAETEPGYGFDPTPGYRTGPARHYAQGLNAGRGAEPAPGYGPDPDHDNPHDWDRGAGPDMASALEPARADGYGSVSPADQAYSVEDRTAVLINHGRASARQQRFTRGHKLAAGIAVGAAFISAVVVMMLPGPGPSWPPSVAKVQAEIVKACQNPDVSSEPGQVNFACAKSTRQILWVFSLLTSGDNPTFADSRTGRVGLEPITPTQGGEVAWSLNLHHPYDPSNPIDSLAVAARAINNIIGGATVTGAYGNPIVQAGLEGHAANCVRYTGSAALTSHKDFPKVCARPISSTAGQAALVADVYQKWVVGAAPMAAQTAATLFANAKNPGSPQVQAILKHLPHLGR